MNQKFKDNLIAEWEQQTGQAWPTTMELNQRTGNIEPKKYQAHHIIPQEFGGPHAWWNMHPAHKDIHQGGIHGKNSELKKIIKKAKQ